MKIRTLLVFVFVFAFCKMNSAQIVSWNPLFVTASDSITVLFDATQGNKALMDVALPIYAHTGLITNKSANPSDWKHAVGNWGKNDSVGIMTSLGNNKYQIKINIPTYYGALLSGEEILKLAFVFRNVDGSIVGKNEDGTDVFIPVFKPGTPSLYLSSPQKPAANNYLFYEQNSKIQLKAYSSVEDSFKLFHDNNLITEFVNDSLIFELPVAISGKHIVKIVFGKAGAQIEDSIVYYTVPAPSVKDLAAGIVDGINYKNDSTVIFSLYAPHKNFVYLIGDFNDWELDTSYLLNKTTDSSHYWIELNTLVPGKEYVFQYLVDGKIRIADPYSEKILDPSNDKSISTSTYPDPKVYPATKTTGIAGVLQTAQTPYNWTVPAFAKPAKTDLVIYELLIRDFIGTHSYATLKDTLNYLKNLGINAIELMPINEFEGNNSWGYNPSFYFSPDKYYGTKKALKDFIDKAHSMGFAVIIDMVLNHSFGQSPMVQMYWDNLKNTPAANSPWFNQVPTHAYNVGYDFNHESDATKYFVKRVNEYWIKEFKVDGYRFDLSKGFTQKFTDPNVGAWGVLDTSRIKIWKGIADDIWSVDNSAYVMLEHLSNNDEETILANYGMMLWGNMNEKYNEATMGFSGPKSDFSYGFYKNRGWNSPHLISYMESHDEERLMVRNKAFGNFSGEYSTKDVNTALSRMEMAAAFFFTIPGPKMIWQFGELGYDISIDFNGRTGTKPIRWTYFVSPERKRLYKIYAALIKLKTTQPAFKTTDVSMSLSGALKSITLKHASMNVKILGNFGVVSGSITPNFAATGKWYDYLTGDSITVTNVTAGITLLPGEYHVYTNKRLAAPDLTIGVEEGALLSENTWDVLNFPNPASDHATIAFDVKQNNTVAIKIVNLIGEEVRLVVDQKYTTGQHTIKWDLKNNQGAQVPNGLYFINVQVGNEFRKSKIIVSK